LFEIACLLVELDDLEQHGLNEFLDDDEDDSVE